MSGLGGAQQPMLGSISSLDAIMALDPALMDHFRRSFVSTYSDFIEQFWKDFDIACTKLQERRDQYHDKGEDVITAALVMYLDGMGYNATHDTKVNGHVDLVVRGKRTEFLWIGEAKRDTGMGWIEQGLDQLCNDYATGTLTQNVGALIIYCQRASATSRCAEWRQRLTDMSVPGMRFSGCTRTPHTAFITEHPLASGGTEFFTRHITLNLHKVQAVPVKKVASKRAARKSVAAKSAINGGV